MERGRRGGSNLAVVKGEGRAADSSPSGSCIGITPTRYHVPSRPPLAEPFTLPFSSFSTLHSSPGGVYSFVKLVLVSVSTDIRVARPSY